MPKERSNDLPQTSSSIGEVGGEGGDNMTEFDRPIGRKAEKANRKRKDGDKDFGEYFVKKLHYIEGAPEQEKRLFESKQKRFE